MYQTEEFQGMSPRKVQDAMNAWLENHPSVQPVAIASSYIPGFEGRTQDWHLRTILYKTAPKQNET